MDALLVNDMRKLTQAEIYIINKLMISSNLFIKVHTQLESSFCEEVSDGGMGSIKLVDYNSVNTILKAADVQLIYKDVDGLIVNITLLLDRNNNLRELDCFKMDFLPLCEPLNEDYILSVVQVTG